MNIDTDYKSSFIHPIIDGECTNYRRLVHVEIPHRIKQDIQHLYAEGQEYKKKWNNLTITKIAEKWEVSADTIRGIADGTAKPTGQTLIEESDVPIIQQLVKDSQRYKREFDNRSPTALASMFDLPVSVIRNIVRKK